MYKKEGVVKPNIYITLATQKQNLSHFSSLLPTQTRRYGVVITRWSRSTKLLYAGPVSTGMGDRSGVQLPVPETYLSI